MDLSDHEDDDNKKSTAKGRDKGLPDIDGPDTLKEFLNKYKKSLLNRRSAFKEVVERLKTEGATDHTILALTLYNCGILQSKCLACLPNIPAPAKGGSQGS